MQTSVDAVASSKVISPRSNSTVAFFRHFFYYVLQQNYNTLHGKRAKISLKTPLFPRRCIITSHHQYPQTHITHHPLTPQLFHRWLRYTQAKGLVYAKYGNPSDVLSYVGTSISSRKPRGQCCCYCHPSNIHFFPHHKLRISIQLPRNPSDGPFSPFIMSSHSAKFSLPGPPRSSSSGTSISSAA